jgi:hypothetical protein
MRRLLQALLGRRRYHDRWARVAAAAESAADTATEALDRDRRTPPARPGIDPPANPDRAARASA